MSIGGAIVKSLQFVVIGKDQSGSKTLRSVGNEAEKSGKKMDGLSAKGKIVAGALAGGAVIAIDALVGFAGAAVDAASAGEQAAGGMKAVFGESAGQIETSAKGAAKNLGLSKTAYMELATVLGAGLKNKGIKDFAGESQNLIGIGADLAAQYGGDTKTAVEALASAMRGESDPIERYGVTLSETAVKAELAAAGQGKLKGKALETAKAAARLRIITQQTADATGAFARESETLAGKQARNAAEYANMQKKIGDGLLPVMLKLATAGAGVLDWMEQNPAVMTAISGAFSGAGEVIMWFAGVLYKALVPSIKTTMSMVATLADGLADMLAAASAMPGMEWLLPAARGMREVANGAADISKAVNQMPDELKFETKPAVTEMDKAKEAVKGIKSEIKTLQGKVVKAEAKGDAKEVKRLKEEIKGLKNKSLEILAKADPKGVVGLKAKIDLIKGKVVTAKAQGMNPEKIKGLQTQIAKLQNKLITVTARIRASGTARWTAGGSGSGAITMRPVAKGAIMDFFANGGIRENHRAQIARAGDWRMWAEPETGGESYIPLAASKRKDSIPIWAETGRRLGIKGFANGGISGGVAGGMAPVNINVNVTVPLGADQYAAGRAIHKELLKLANGPLKGRGLRLESV